MARIYRHPAPWDMIGAMSGPYEFHISRRARDRYAFDETLFSSDCRLVYADFGVARRFVERVYAVSGKLIPASEVYAAGLIEEILHLLIRHYERSNPSVMARALAFLYASLDARLDEALTRFVIEFPTPRVYAGRESVEDYLKGSSGGIPHRQVAIEELLLLSLDNQNPALEPFSEFCDDSLLIGTACPQAVRLLGEFFARQAPMGPVTGGSVEALTDILAAPAKAAPYSLEGQLQFLLEKWGALLGQDLVQLILRGMDYVREEVMRHAGPGVFSAAPPVPEYHGELEYERYSPDTDWMPRLVLMAKNSYVWLEQLSRKYQRWIRTLDEIPDEELDLLARNGFSGLWLIGLWERSRASERIKQRMGQADAVASAYAVDSYEIAVDLGGWDALRNLRARAGQRGIRLSADMVPNHMGVDSRWVIEHPDWFLSLEQPPYPSYSFNSGDLADGGRVGIRIEDHYYDHSDAAVVFERRDSWTGAARYIYHGNDGTSYPWNDTAQLDYSSAEVREAVIQTILHVARNFPIIRFDAAMTLAKKHIQRLWFPEPGAGGAIPSRSEHGLTRAEFDAAMPEEFWRQVVDRVAAEVPETLLLAEAFWLLEGYFVRTLGMHRVYNSAFMHMLRDEENSKYRQLIKNTLEFDPQILKRYVNFMSNPDEKTAIEQFGTGDKYFGVCTLLAALPGLPMFGHGQIEGFREKYGMEYQKPKWDESPDAGLVQGHEWKIFPLLHQRGLFADVQQFHLFDFFVATGKVNEDVFAFSNRQGDARALILYHNRFRETRGWVKLSAAALDKGSGRLMQRTLGEALGLPAAGYAIFQDYVTHLEYMRPCSELRDKGLYAELGAYQHHAFMEWHFVEGPEWGAVLEALAGAGVESVQRKRDEMFGASAVATAPVAASRAGRQAAQRGSHAKKGIAKSSAPRKAAKASRSTKKAPAKKPTPKGAALKKAARRNRTTAKPASNPKRAPVAKKPSKRTENKVKPSHAVAPSARRKKPKTK
jgi:glycosidase